MTTSEKIADINAMVDYITALSIRYKERICISTMPPEGGKQRYTRVDIGFGRSGILVTGNGDDLMVHWTAEDGSIQRARLEELQEAAGKEQG